MNGISRQKVLDRTIFRKAKRHCQSRLINGKNNTEKLIVYRREMKGEIRR